MKERLDCGKSRAHYVSMSLCNEAHSSHYKKAVQGANVSSLEVVVVDNGLRKEDLQSFDGVGGDETQEGYDVEALVNIIRDINLMEEPIQSSSPKQF